jgi:hypothetical protein
MEKFLIAMVAIFIMKIVWDIIVYAFNKITGLGSTEEGDGCISQWVGILVAVLILIFIVAVIKFAWTTF